MEERISVYNKFYPKNMKLLYIDSARIPTEKAHGLQIMKMCEAFALCNPNGAGGYSNTTNSIEVELVVPRRLNPIKQDPFEYYGVKRNFRIKRLPCLDFIPLERFLGPLAFWLTELSFLVSLLFYFIISKEDIIYTRDKFVGFIFPLFKKNIFFEAHTIPSRVFFLFPRTPRSIIAITHGLGGALQSLGINREKILVAPDAVDLEQFTIKETQEECRKKLGLPLGKKIILYTGHLYPWKGVGVLAQAARYLDGDTLVFLIGGTKKDVATYNIQHTTYPPTGDHPQGDNIRVVGHRPHKDIPYWLKAADVLILPNSAKYGISKYWTSPLKLFEYMASGTPIVASNLPSIQEVLSDSNAVLVEPDSPKELVLSIQYIFDNKRESKRLAANAQKSASKYTWAKRASSIIKFIYAPT